MKGGEQDSLYEVTTGLWVLFDEKLVYYAYDEIGTFFFLCSSMEERFVMIIKLYLFAIIVLLCFLIFNHFLTGLTLLKCTEGRVFLYLQSERLRCMGILIDIYHLLILSTFAYTILSLSIFFYSVKTINFTRYVSDTTLWDFEIHQF